MGHPIRRATVLVALALTSCSEEAAPGGPSAAEVATTYADVLHASYDDAVLGARALDGAIDAFLAAPSEATLATAREAWIDARPAYLQTEVARFYDGPIDHPDTGPEGRLNAWPLDEAYVDYVVGADDLPIHGGIVNDPEILETIDAEGLGTVNAPGAEEENVSLGYHAIEFLLWGQDLRTDGAGDRPHTDYVDGMAMNVERRRAFLDVASDLLVTDLETVRDAWAPGDDGNYRAELLALAESDPGEALRRILLGMGSLSGAELAGERMNVAFMTRDQEDEHSCFSDTTTQDQLYDAQGIQNVYLGHYERVDGSIVEGASLSDYVAARDAELDAQLVAELEASVAQIGEIPAPFDQAILGADDAPGRTAIRESITALREQTSSIARVAGLLGVVLNLEE